MSARRKRVISTEKIQFNHSLPKCYWPKKKGVSQNGKNGQTQSIIGICLYCVLDRPVFERCQTLLYPELTLWWSFLLVDGAHHKKPHSPIHPKHIDGLMQESITAFWRFYRRGKKLFAKAIILPICKESPVLWVILKIGRYFRYINDKKWFAQTTQLLPLKHQTSSQVSHSKIWQLI